MVDMSPCIALLEWDAPEPGHLHLKSLPWVKGRHVARALLYRKLNRMEVQCLDPCLVKGAWRFVGESTWRHTSLSDALESS